MEQTFLNLAEILKDPVKIEEQIRKAVALSLWIDIA